MTCSRDVKTTLPDGYHALLADGFADHSECLLSDFAVRHDVVGAVEVDLVDLLARHELVDLDCAFALDSNGFKLFRRDLKVLAFADFSTSSPVSASTLRYLIRFPVCL